MTARLLPVERRVVLESISWETYQSLARDFAGRPSKVPCGDSGCPFGKRNSQRP